MTITADALTTALRFDFKPGDVGDTPTDFTARLAHITQAAVLRSPATDAQIDAGARYLLISAQIRQLTRQAERQKSASGAEIQQDLASRMAALRLEQQAALAASGLAPATPARQGSVSVDVVSVF